MYKLERKRLKEQTREETGATKVVMQLPTTGETERSSDRTPHMIMNSSERLSSEDRGVCARKK